MTVENMSTDSAMQTVHAAGQAGYVSEIFCSIQGEGIFVGDRQVFFRTAGCRATCYWCDTVSSKRERAVCLVHSENKRSLSNPLTIGRAADEVLNLIQEFAPVRSVSLTGGEPLEQSRFVAGVAEVLRRHHLRVFLETNGLEVEGLNEVLPHTDVVAMDIKLPHATGEVHWDVHREFLAKLAGKTVFVKVVVDSTTPFEEIVQAVRIIAESDAKIPLVLQPESSTYFKDKTGPEGRRILSGLLADGQRMALETLRDVRVIPQVHKILKIR
jgi:organic radical activating enzyme